MVDVTGKAATRRVATARAVVVMEATTAAAIANSDLPKGDVIAVARIAGVMAAKRTTDLIPLCHPLALNQVDIDLRVERTQVIIECTARTTGKTGVEMEALTGASVAALTIYDMAKAIDRGMRIEGVEVLSKSGGASGSWHRQPGQPLFATGGGDPEGASGP